MKWLLAIGIVLLLAVSVHADVYVSGYTRSNGTYVQPYYSSNPDGNPYNNFSSKGNVNPYTGETGTVIPKASIGQYNPYQTYYSPTTTPRYKSQYAY